MARVWRVHHGRPTSDPDGVAVLSPAESHHVRRVLRLRVGDSLHVFDGGGREWASTLIECGPERVAIRLGAELTDRVEPEIEVVLYQGACRPERMDWVVQKATECGCAGIHWLSLARARENRATAQRLERWRRIALEACKQSGRRRIPVVEGVDVLPPPGGAVLGLLLDPAADSPSLADRLSVARPPAVWLAVGPESGFAAEEIDAFVAAGWLRAGLGPRTLRTETAGITAAAIVLHRWADLGT